MLARLSAFVIWALVAATAVFWGLRLFVRAPAAPAYAVPVGETAAVKGDLSRLLGSTPVNAPAAVIVPGAASRFKLLGIVAPKNAGAGEGHGVALIAVDGKLAKAFTVGARLDGDLVLQSVSLRSASIGAGPGAPAITLELPPPTTAATGRLPAGASNNGNSGASAVVPPSMPPQFVPQAVPAPQPPPLQVQPAAPPQAPAAPPQINGDPNAPAS